MPSANDVLRQHKESELKKMKAVLKLSEEVILSKVSFSPPDSPLIKK
jgi:hypothetical protein